MITRSPFTAGFAILLLCLHANAADWKVGLASTVITPKEPVYMSGYASRNKPSEGVESELYLKVLTVEDAKGHRGAIVTSDVIGIRGAMADSICPRITAETGLQRGEIILNSSHTHTGPSLTSSEYGADPEKAAVNDRYIHWLEDQIVATVAASLKSMEPASLEWGVGVIHFPMNRREYTDKGVILGVNPRGFADRSVPVLKVSGADGKLRAVLFGAACHNTTLGGNDYRISGDFAGFAQEHVEKALPGTQAMFMQGCAGDTNPYPRGTYDIARDHGLELGEEVVRVLETKLKPVRGPLRTAFDHADLPLQKPPSREEIDALVQAKNSSWRGWVAGQMLKSLEQKEPLPDHYRAPFGVWQFGEDLTLVALSGEVVGDYVRLLEDSLGPLRLWISAYCNDVYGYLPSARVLREAGYETRGLYSGGIGFFAPEAEQVTVAKIREMASKVQRPMGK